MATHPQRKVSSFSLSFIEVSKNANFFNAIAPNVSSSCQNSPGFEHLEERKNSDEDKGSLNKLELKLGDMSLNEQ